MRKIFSLVIVLAFALGLITPNVSYSLDAIVLDGNVSCSETMGTVIDKNGNLFIWGDSTSGQLGDGKAVSKYLSPTKLLSGVKFVDVTNSHGAAVMENGDLYVWGRVGGMVNDWLSTPAATYSKPIKIMSGVRSVSLDNDHRAVIKENGELWTWGTNMFANLGNNYEGNVTGKWTYDTDNYALYPIQTIPVKIMDGVIQAKMNGTIGIALKEDGSVWTWGGNRSGELGNGGGGNSYTTIKNDEMISCAVQTVPAKILDNVIYIDTGFDHVAAITKEGKLLMWGVDNYFRDNFGSIVQNYPVQIMENVAHVACGKFNTAIVTKKGELYVMGNNFYGQLGNGTEKDIAAPIKIMEGVNSVDIYNGCTIIVKNDGSVLTCGETAICGNGGKSNATGSYGDKLQTVPVKIMDGAKLVDRASTPPPPPVDEPSGWAKPIMEKAINAGMIKENLKHSWQKPIPRVEAAGIVVGYLEATTGKSIDQILSEKKITINTSTFTDTQDRNVLAVYELGIVTGFGNNEFRPNSTLTRAQLAVLLCNTAEVLGINTKGHSSTFTDTTNHWASSFIGWPAYAGIVVGTGNNKFSPDAPLTKEQTIAAFYSMFIMP